MHDEKGSFSLPFSLLTLDAHHRILIRHTPRLYNDRAEDESHSYHPYTYIYKGTDGKDVSEIGRYPQLAHILRCKRSYQYGRQGDDDYILAKHLQDMTDLCPIHLSDGDFLATSPNFVVGVADDT